MPSVYHPNTMSRQSLLNHLALIRADLNVLWTMARPEFKTSIDKMIFVIDLVIKEIRQYQHIRSGATLYEVVCVNQIPGKEWNGITRL